MRLTTARFTPLVIVAAVAALFGWSCAGSGDGSADGGADGKKDAPDAGSGGKADSGTGGKADASMDTPADQTKADAGADGADARADVPADTADAPADARADVPADTTVDGSGDAPDAPIEAPVDRPADAAPEAALEAMPEAAPETAPEAEPETAPETNAAMDTAPDTGADTGSTFLAIEPCGAAGDYVTTPTTIAFRTGTNGYDPACLKVTKGATVTWTGDFDAAVGHPLEARAGGTSDNPITLTDTDVGSKSFTFPKAGFFPYHCRRHADMIGVIWVSD